MDKAALRSARSNVISRTNNRIRMFKENEKPLLTGNCLLRGIREPEVLFVAAEFEPAIQRIINDKPVPQHGVIITSVEVRKTQADSE